MMMTDCSGSSNHMVCSSPNFLTKLSATIGASSCPLQLLQSSGVPVVTKASPTINPPVKSIHSNNKRSAHKAGVGSARPIAKHPRMSGSRKRVRFEEHRNTVIAQNEPTASFSPWYHAGEYRSFQLEARNTILAYFQAAANGSEDNNPFAKFLLDPSQHCLRGLEKHQFPPQARALYKAQNRQFIQLIIGEHMRLRQLHTAADAEKELHDFSTLYTVTAKTYALHLALSEEAD